MLLIVSVDEMVSTSLWVQAWKGIDFDTHNLRLSRTKVKISFIQISMFEIHFKPKDFFVFVSGKCSQDRSANLTNYYNNCKWSLPFVNLIKEIVSLDETCSARFWAQAWKGVDFETYNFRLSRTQSENFIYS